MKNSKIEKVEDNNILDGLKIKQNEASTLNGNTMNHALTVGGGKGGFLQNDFP
jgi:hypothetical protein